MRGEGNTAAIQGKTNYAIILAGIRWRLLAEEQANDEKKTLRYSYSNPLCGGRGGIFKAGKREWDVEVRITCAKETTSELKTVDLQSPLRWNPKRELKVRRVNSIRICSLPQCHRDCASPPLSSPSCDYHHVPPSAGAPTTRCLPGRRETTQAGRARPITLTRQHWRTSMLPRVQACCRPQARRPLGASASRMAEATTQGDELLRAAEPGDQ